MKADSVSKRPVFLDPLKIRLPVTATASLAHRISGVLLAVALPFLVQALSLSLRGPEGYNRITAALHGPVKAMLVILAWALAHHSAAGVRHILFDAGVGTKLAPAKRSAWAVHIFAVAVALLIAGALR